MKTGNVKEVDFHNAGPPLETVRYEKKDGHIPSPEENATCFNLLFFWWVVDVLKKFGHKSFDLFSVALYDPLPQDESSYLQEVILSNWEVESENDKHKLLKCLLKSIGKPALLCIPAALLYSICSLSSPVLVSQLARRLDSRSGDMMEAYLLGVAIVLFSVCFAFANSWTFHPCFRVGMRTRAALSSLIYQKVLSLPPYEICHIGSGHILNLFSTDLEIIAEATRFSAFLFIGPLVSGVGSILLLYETGISALAGIAFFVLVLCQAIWMSKISAVLRTSIASATDKRIQIMDEVLHAIHVIKQYAWEPLFGKIIHDLRRTELIQIGKQLLATAVGFVGLRCYGLVITVLIVCTHVFSGHYITVELTIMIFGWAMVINYQTHVFVINCLQVASASRSLDRIQAFLCNTADKYAHSLNSLEGDKGIQMKDVTSHWCIADGHIEFTRSVTTFTLHVEEIRGRSPQLIFVVGQVGSGKSSLLMTLLGEMRIISGELHINGSTGYSSQEPWVFSDTIQNNILFGTKMYQRRYKEVLRACCLEKDLGKYPLGDQTVVGERGLTLSGGQKARINLARAVYQDRNIYLLDDPLSAVDSEIGNQIMEQCIQGILKDKLVVMCSHQTQYLSLADHVIMLHQGEMVGSGNYNQVKHQLIDLQLNPNLCDTTEDECAAVDFGEETNAEKELSADHQMSNSGLMKTVWEYLKAGTFFPSLIMITSVIVAEMITIVCGIRLTEWANDIENNTAQTNVSNNTSHDSTQELGRLSNYHATFIALFVLGMIVTRILNHVGLTVLSVIASSRLHRRIFTAITSAPLSFFEHTSLGDILNRFARDLGFVDTQIVNLLRTIVPSSIETMGMLGFTVWVNPWASVGILPYLALVAVIRWYAVRGASQLKRLEATCKGPMFSHISVTLGGLITIRAFGVESKFTQSFHNLQNRHTSAWNNYICINRWMTLYISLATSGFLAIIVTAALSVTGTGLDSGLFGYSLIVSISCIENIAYMMTVIGEAESMFTSVDRILQCTHIPQEAGGITDIRPPDEWPSGGAIVMNKLSLKYSHQQAPTLKNISLSINAGEKVGIIGRSGAGKTSLFNAILRLDEPTGCIAIDGIDVTQIGLRDLRTKITSIPQEPVLITGTLRRNLDPTLLFDDGILWDVLGRVELKLYTMELPDQLDSDVGENGSNFSVGQKQLICLGRALLRENKILLIDEGTANVDNTTDSLIQNSIRMHFAHCTVLTIAHRSNTILDSDRILVIEDGVIGEFDCPMKLFENKNSLFYHYCMQNHVGIEDLILGCADSQKHEI